MCVCRKAIERPELDVPDVHDDIVLADGVVQIEEANAQEALVGFHVSGYQHCDVNERLLLVQLAGDADVGRIDIRSVVVDGLFPGQWCPGNTTPTSSTALYGLQDTSCVRYASPPWG